MFSQIIELLQSGKFYGVSENVEIAKGKYEIPKSLKQAYEQGKRKGYGNK